MRLLLAAVTSMTVLQGAGGLASYAAAALPSGSVINTGDLEVIYRGQLISHDQALTLQSAAELARQEFVLTYDPISSAQGLAHAFDTVAEADRYGEDINVSVDYLVIEDAHRRPRHSAENILGDKLADLAALDADDQAAILKVLDALVVKHKLQALTGGAS